MPNSTIDRLLLPPPIEPIAVKVLSNSADAACAAEVIRTGCICLQAGADMPVRMRCCSAAAKLRFQAIPDGNFAANRRRAAVCNDLRRAPMTDQAVAVTDGRTAWESASLRRQQLSRFQMSDPIRSLPLRRLWAPARTSELLHFSRCACGCCRQSMHPAASASPRCPPAWHHP